jgi:hypothetical protein
VFGHIRMQPFENLAGALTPVFPQVDLELIQKFDF